MQTFFMKDKNFCGSDHFFKEQIFAFSAKLREVREI